MSGVNLDDEFALFEKEIRALDVPENPPPVSEPELNPSDEQPIPKRTKHSHGAVISAPAVKTITPMPPSLPSVAPAVPPKQRSNMQNIGTSGAFSNYDPILKPDHGDEGNGTDGISGHGKKGKAKKMIRSAAGEIWEDKTLEEWDPNDYRIFVGDLGNEVTDDILANAFRAYPTFQKARVVFDKRNQKPRGYGFVSFSDSGDYVKAMREMNNKYVGSRPVKLRKSNWRDRNLSTQKQKAREKRKLLGGRP